MIFSHKSRLFRKVINCWLLYKKFSIKPSTYYRYKYIINKYIVQYFGDKSIYFFIDYDFNIYIEQLLQYLSPKTVSDIIIVLKSILKYIEKKYRLNFNLDLISLPKNKSSEIKILSDNEVAKLEEFCVDGYNPRYIGMVVCLNTGLRIGEICALKWEDIDLEEKLISVNKTVQRIYKGKNNTELRIDEPKTYYSIRKVPHIFWQVAKE